MSDDEIIAEDLDNAVAERRAINAKISLPPPAPLPSSDVTMSDSAMPIVADRGPEVVASTLAPQLGSDMNHLSRGEFDMRKLSVITERDIPFLMYAALRGRKSRVWRDVFELFLNLRVSVNGRGRKDIIRMEGVSKGGLPEIPTEIEKPGWLERNVLNRNWKQQVKEEYL